MAEVAARVLAAAAEEEKKYASINIEKPLGTVTPNCFFKGKLKITWSLNAQLNNNRVFFW